MQAVLTDRPVFDTAAEFVAALNKARLAVGKKWITYQGQVQGVDVAIKTYNTGYLQICRVNGREQGAPMDMKPTAWKEFIQSAIEAQVTA